MLRQDPDQGNLNPDPQPWFRYVKRFNSPFYCPSTVKKEKERHKSALFLPSNTNKVSQLHCCRPGSRTIARSGSGCVTRSGSRKIARFGSGCITRSKSQSNAEVRQMSGQDPNSDPLIEHLSPDPDPYKAGLQIKVGFIRFWILPSRKTGSGSDLRYDP